MKSFAPQTAGAECCGEISDTTTVIAATSGQSPWVQPDLLDRSLDETP